MTGKPLILLLACGAVAAFSGSSTAADVHRADPKVPPTKQRLAADALALRSISRQEPPTLGRLFRRIRFLTEQGEPAQVPSVTWFDSPSERERVLQAAKARDNPQETFLVVPGSGPKRHPRLQVIRRGSFFAGITKERELYCSTATAPGPQPCQ